MSLDIYDKIAVIVIGGLTVATALLGAGIYLTWRWVV